MTVARAIHQHMPNEQLVYFGDTAHLPYGEKSAAAIQAYSVKIADVLLSHGCKAIVIACNSASSAAYDLMKEYVASRSEVINVIDPMVETVTANYKHRHVGLIGTRQTVHSNVYGQKLRDAVRLSSLVTALLVPMIEEGFLTDKISHDVIEKYLNDPSLLGIDALILGCTHYPLIKTEIDAFYKNKVDILDSSEIVARHLQAILKKKSILAEQTGDESLFYVSDYTPAFEALTRQFFGQRVHLINHKLWE